jgi:oxepin-CoA hydrolase/3-oxo-5,6-dehydrosuberyl-CoA semialdehyde dehydrogenase
MPALSESNVQTYLGRFAKVTPDAKPLWGKMSGAQMLGHVTSTLLYSLGETPLLQFRGNFKTQYIYAPLLLNGILKFPKNVPLPRGKNAPPPKFPEGDLASLKAATDRVLAEARAGEFAPPHHPYFGNIGPKRWLKFHAAHFDHHLRQFGL